MSKITTTVQTGDIKRSGEYVHGDMCWIDYGGALLVNHDSEDPNDLWLEVVTPLHDYDPGFKEDPEFRAGCWEIHQICLDMITAYDLKSPNHDHGWIDLHEIAKSMGMEDLDAVDIRASLLDPDPRERIMGILMVGEYYGMGELDHYPESYNVKEIRKRYPDEDPTIDCEHEADLSDVTTKPDPDSIAFVFRCKHCGEVGEFVPDLDDIDW